MESTEKCLILVSWFPGCSDDAALDCLREKAGVDGIEMRYLDDDAIRLANAWVVVSFHLPTLPGEQVEINLASEEILKPYRDGRMGLLELAKVPFLGYHFGYSCLRVCKAHGPEEALSPTISREETAERIGTTVQELAKITGKQILVENMDYGPTGALEYVCEARFTREVCERFGCGMLWDIGHGLVSAAAKNLGEEEYMGSYVEELAAHVREIHINSPRAGMDMHLPATDLELSWLERMLHAGANPYAVVIERAWGERRGLDFAEALVPEVRAVKQVLEKRDIKNNLWVRHSLLL